MVVQEGQRVVDDVVDVVEIDEQQGLCADTLNCQIDISNQHIRTRIDAHEIGDSRVEIQLRSYAIDFEKDSLDAEIRNVEHDIVFRILVRASGSTGDLCTAGNSTCGPLRGETVDSQSSVERARRISR